MHLFTPIEGSITQKNIHGGTRGPDMSRAKFEPQSSPAYMQNPLARRIIPFLNNTISV